ncbi:M48 family metalloprotease [Kitasatospora sp. NPDC048194]|uniref:M48 family metallopeptidase n=1 Tax=Kitasatospora sp. NPDC048194 TaxID=3364045 RepID=UPI00371E52E3
MTTPVETAPDRPAHGSPCPSCGAVLTADPRFTAWCPACDWNLAPGQVGAPAPTRRERATAARTDRLFEEQAGGGDSPTARLDWLLASSAAGLVHLVSVGLFALGLWLLVTGNVVQRCTGAVVLVIVIALRPRLGRVPRDEDVLDRGTAPALYGLADRVAAEVGAAPVDVIRITGEFNASYGLVGLRRRSVLELGLPLWEVLDDRERIALLGHEFGHRVNGDHRRSFWLYSAVAALAGWYHMARPGRSGWGAQLEYGGPANGVPLLLRLGAILGAAVLRAVAWLLLQGLRLFDRLTLRAGQQAEYRADALAVRVGGREAAHGMLAALLLTGSAVAAIGRIRAEERRRPRVVRRGRAQAPRPVGPRTVETKPVQPKPVEPSSVAPKPLEPAPVESAPVESAPAGPDRLWERLREHLASVPASERERLLRLSALQRTAVDASHPPTHLRIALVDRAGDQPAAVTSTEAEAAAVAAELAPHRARIAAGLLSG